jgi:ATP-dependent Lon protease
MSSVREQRRRTRSGEAGPPPQAPPKSPKNKKKGGKNGQDETVRWVDDDTLFDDVDDEDDDDDSTYVDDEDDDETDESESEETNIHGIRVPANMPVSVKIHLHANVGGAEMEYEDDEDEEEEEEEQEDDDEVDDDFLAKYLAHQLGRGYRTGGGGRAPAESALSGPMLIISDDSTTNRKKKGEKNEDKEIPIKLYRKEREYYDEMPRKTRKALLKKMYSVSDLLGESEMPFKFRVLELDTTPKIQTEIIRKVDAMTRMGPESGETQKLRNWVDAILRVPFGKNIPLPVTFEDKAKCADFLRDARSQLDKATYGMVPAKTQIMQILAQWISNPTSVGNCIAMKGPMGTGKTSFARNGIAKVLQRPFMFFSLGGASDIAHYSGHSYTYEGSMWGRIIDAIMQARCMNPVLYFDELDKISGTPHGEEITSMLIHLTDRSQNTQYHDRYFAGIDFDLSQCLFVFSFNDETKVHPVLKDRMSVIQCSGYKDDEKKIIVANYVWPEVLKHAGIAREDLTATEEAAEYIIKEYSKGEQGMRNIIRVVETVVSRINLLRISDEETAKAYKFYTKITFPARLTKETVKAILADFSAEAPETWRSMYN